MCLIINQDYPDCLTAAKPLKVYKVLHCSDVSPYRHTPYSCQQSLHVKNMRSRSRGIGGIMVARGFHAFTTCDLAAGMISESWNSNDYKVVAMTIPVGGHYFIGNDGDIVSDKIDTGTLKAIEDSRSYYG